MWEYALMPDDLLEKRSGHTQSVSRALSLLIRLSDEPEGLNLSELARRVKLAPSTAHRLLTTLQLDQFVRFEDGRWLTGVQSFNVGSAYLRARDLCYMSRPYLRILMQETGETSNLALVENDELVYLAQTECPELMRALARPGAKAPLTCSAVGKAALAFMPRQQAEQMIDKAGILQMTRKSHVTAASLWRDLDQIRNRGFAFDNEEHSDGLRCVAAPLFNKGGEVLGAISVSGPSVRVSDQKLSVHGRAVQRVASDLTRALGGAVPNDNN
jgi:IclR family acetate operon transcriptional repressor